MEWMHTITFVAPPLVPPCADSGFEWMMGVTGSDEVLFILGVKIFERDKDLDIEGFSCAPFDEPSRARLATFSTSEELLWIKLNLGKRLLIDDLPLDEDGPGDPDPLILTSEGLGVKRKFTFLGVWGIFIAW